MNLSNFPTDSIYRASWHKQYSHGKGSDYIVSQGLANPGRPLSLIWASYSSRKYRKVDKTGLGAVYESRKGLISLMFEPATPVSRSSISLALTDFCISTSNARGKVYLPQDSPGEIEEERAIHHTGSHPLPQATGTLWHRHWIGTHNHQVQQFLRRQPLKAAYCTA